MMRIFVLVLAALMLWNLEVFAEKEDYETACTEECNFLTKDCTAYIDCRVARAQCLESCMQRKVWEKVAGSLDKLTVVLEKQAQEKEEKEKNPPPPVIAPSIPSQPQNTTKGSQSVSDSAK